MRSSFVSAGHPLAKPIDLRTPLSLSSSFHFPLQHALARREVFIGAALLLLPGIGWILNMGHRIMMVHHMLHGRPAWPSWSPLRELLRHGTIAFGGMLYYMAPGLVLTTVGGRTGSMPIVALGVLLSAVAIVAIPGFMTCYCSAFDPTEIYDPFRALSRVRQGGRAYWHAWGIALAALLVSLVGLAALGVGFLVTSVWFWQAAGFSFARVFVRQHTWSGSVA